MIYFSKENLGFYPKAMQAHYTELGTWPSDAVELTDLERSTFWMQSAQNGKELGGDSEGRPMWVDLPPLSSEDKVALDDRLSKQAGLPYGNTGVTVPFTSNDAMAVLQVKAAFEVGLTNTVIKFSNDQSLPMKSSDFNAFARWFATERNRFFI